MLAAAMCVEAVMLTLLVANSVRLLYGSLTEQAQLHASQVTPVLNAALVAPLAQRDYATVQAVLDESRAAGGVEYLAVLDSSGKLVALSGWPRDRALPPPEQALSLAPKEAGSGTEYRYDVRQPVALAGQALGTVQFGLDLGHIVSARKDLLTQGIAIAVIEILLSAGLLTLLGLWLTRHLTLLTRASEAMAAGDDAPPVMAEGNDDIGRLGAAFNTMSRAIRERVDQLTVSRDELEALARDVDQERARLSSLLAAMDFGVLFVGRDGRIAFANPAVGKLFGIAELPIGATLESAFAGAGNAARDADLAALAAVDADELREMVLADGRIVSWHNVPVRNAGGAQAGKLWLCVDVTEPQRAARQLRQAKEEAEAANRAKTEFLATVSHELRTPMNGVLGNLSLLTDGNLPAEERRLADVAHRSAETLLRLLDDILDLSKLDARRIELEEADCVVTDLVEGVIDVMRPRAAEKGLALSCHALPTVPEVIVTDPARLRQVLFNLIGNAVKFTETGHVAVRVRRGAAVDDTRFFLEFEVEDTGIGIAPDALRILFDRFTQADSSITRRYGGTGLGLAICRELCAMMGGSIDVDTAPGRGSVFRFTIVCRLGDPSALRPVERDMEEAARSVELPPLRVLAVDDVDINRDIVRGMLERAGHSVTLAASGSEALRLARDTEFDLVLMDIQMPGMDGLTATRMVRGMAGPRGQVPIIALTAHASGSSRPECLSAGMNGFVTKPLRPAALLAEIAHILHGPDHAGPAPQPAQQPSAAAPAALLDDEQIGVLREVLSPEEWHHSLSEFAIAARAEIAAIATAATAGESHRALAHTLKGMSLNVGAAALGAIARDLEHAPAAAALERHAEMEAVLERTLGAMAAWTPRQSASAS
ncbi:histidine kinase (plasmid) [Azospirillum thermophilum]|uniref:histidine kinase n=2 Tax=Azospirillum thermophilum TaxID=2202148 RepID=A0A2S2D0Z3_9PROT|nr:histidine kinase [Azospirillum thermophilum]